MLSSPTHPATSSFLGVGIPGLHQPGDVIVDSPSDSSDLSSFNVNSSSMSNQSLPSGVSSRSDLLLGTTKSRGSVFGASITPPPSRGLGGRRLSTTSRRYSSIVSGGKHRRRVGRYRRGKVLGSGATGTVYQGIDQLTGQLVAIKEVRADGNNDVQREFDLLQRMNHENIVRYLDAEISAKKLVVYMELVDGGSLASLVTIYGKLTESVLRHYVRQITAGLEYLHDNNVIHRDIKPGNLLVTTNGVVKLADFGTSKSLSVTPQPDTGGFVGTAVYAAPEAIRGNPTYSSDIWSMGVSIVELATGRNPWEGVLNAESPLEFILKLPKEDLRPIIPSDLSDDAKEFIELCLERDWGSRVGCKILGEHSFLTSLGVLLPLLRCDSDVVMGGGKGKPSMLDTLQDTDLLSGIPIAEEIEEEEEEGVLEEMRGLYIAAHCCNDDQANIVFENINDRGSAECSISRGRPYTPNISPYAAKRRGSFTNRAHEEYGEVTGTPDGLISLKLPTQISEDDDDLVPPSVNFQSSSYKFDVFFSDKTSPHGLFERIGNPIIDNMLNGKFGKKISLSCSSMMYAGECCMSIGKLTQDVGVSDAEGQGFTPIIVDKIFSRCSGQYEIYVSSISAKRDKNAVFDNIHKKVVDGDDVIWKWSRLGPLVRTRAHSAEHAFRLMDLPQLAFSGVLAPQTFIIELFEPNGAAEPRSTLYLSLFYGRQWIFWLNGLSYAIQKYFAYGYQPEEEGAVLQHQNSMSAFDEEARLYRHPLLVLTEEVFRDEDSMNYVLHNFHTKVENVEDIVDSLSALSNAARKKK